MDTALLQCKISKAPDDTYLFTGSDETLDRDGEIIHVRGWDLKEYQKNPVILWAHNHSIPAIGKSTSTYKRNGKLSFRVKFASEGIHQLADMVKALIDDDIIKACSVGYMAKERNYESEDQGVRVETFKAELYELSIVNVGANPNALLNSLEGKGFKSEDIDFIMQSSILSFDDVKPYANEHACRLKDPGQYDRFARKNCEQKSDGKCIDVIYGIKSGKSEVQALRYKKDVWTAGAARSHCKGRGGTFEAASESSAYEIHELYMDAFEAIEEKIDNLTEMIQSETKQSKGKYDDLLSAPRGQQSDQQGDASTSNPHSYYQRTQE